MIYSSFKLKDNSDNNYVYWKYLFSTENFQSAQNSTCLVL